MTLLTLTAKEILFTFYYYCTDLCINLANIFHISYYEINYIIFCILHPIIMISVPIFYIIKKRKLHRLKQN